MDHGRGPLQQFMTVRYHPMFRSDTRTDLETTYPKGRVEQLHGNRRPIGKSIAISLTPLRIECHVSARMQKDSARAFLRYASPPLFD